MEDVSVYEDQDSISQWGRETFGEGPPMASLLRCMLEMVELAIAITYEQDHELIVDELADVDIVLDQVATRLGIRARDRQLAKNAKMKINRAREWGRTANGRAQHVEGT